MLIITIMTTYQFVLAIEFKLSVDIYKKLITSAFDQDYQKVAVTQQMRLYLISYQLCYRKK